MSGEKNISKFFKKLTRVHMSEPEKEQMASPEVVKSAAGPVEPTKPPDIDPETTASAANAVEQWRNYQQAYSAYQQQCAAYQHYVQQTQYAQTVEQQQMIYNQYLEQHRHYQYQLQQYEQYKLGNGLVPYGGTVSWQSVGPMQSFPIDPSMMQPEFQQPIRPPMGPLAMRPTNGNNPGKGKGAPDTKHRRDGKSKPKQKPPAQEKKNELHTKTIIYLNPDDEKLLPQELKQLFGDFHCNLCRTRMNSHISANIHYQSKAHEKKINQWLKEYCVETGTPMPVRQRPALELAADTASIGKSVFHCEACDLVLTSVQHANQHYTGKRHWMVVNGKKLPSGNGHYNNEGKWIRTTNIVTDVVVPSTPTPSTESPSAPQPVAKKRLLEPLPHEEPTRNGVKNARLEPPPEPPQQLIAQVLAAETNFANDVCVPPITQPSPLVTPVIPNAILPASQPIVTINVDSDEDVVEVTNTTSPPVIPSTTTPAIASIAPSKSAETTLEQEIRKKEGLDCVDDTGTFCLICETSVTSRSEMVTHLKGSKHVKKARSMGVIVRTTPFNASDTILRSLSVPARQTDWSLYRMPSGKFYCKTCNLIVTDEKLFGQHWYGKKHKLKLRQEQQADEEARTGTTVTGGGTATATESSFVLDDLEITPMAATNPTGSDKSVPGSSPGTAATSRKRKPFSKKWLYFYRKAKWAAVTK
uniref:C2H2-type domain-containing protein n=1 Tax=Anopheles minimus TaxID=112268 RepID=A0A182WER9_9DIPT